MYRLWVYPPTLARACLSCSFKRKWRQLKNVTEVRPRALLSAVISLLCSAIVFVSDCAGQVQEIGLDGMTITETLSARDAVATLTYLSVSIKRNFQDIHTWTGECLDEIQALPPIEGATEHVTSRRRHRFSVDLDLNRLATSYVRIAEGSTDNLPSPENRVGVLSALQQVVLPDRLLVHMPGVLTAGFRELPGVSLPPNSRISIKMPSENRAGLLADSIDPRNYFRIVHSEPLWDEYERSIDNYGKGDVERDKMMRFLRISRGRRDGRMIYRLAWHDLREGRLMKEHFHDVDAGGGNITRVVVWPRGRATNGEPRLIYDYEYTEVNGVFLPSKFTASGASPRMHRQLSFENQAVNVNLEEKAFSLEFFSVGDGAYVTDDIQQKVYRTRGNDLELLGDYGATSLVSAGKLEPRSIIIYGSPAESVGD